MTLLFLEWVTTGTLNPLILGKAGASQDRLNGTDQDARNVVADLWSMDDLLTRQGMLYVRVILGFHSLHRSSQQARLDSALLARSNILSI